MTEFKFDPRQPDPIYVQLANYIARRIGEGQLGVGDKLLSVNTAYKVCGVSRDTVIAAYNHLQKRGLVTAVAGKGVYVAQRTGGDKTRVFVFFDAMNQYKEILFRSLTDHLGPDYEVNAFFHYYDAELFDRIVESARGKYDYYVLMPHFKEDVTATLNKIPVNQLLLLDAFPASYSRNCAAVYQDFASDAYEELCALHDKLKRYEALYVVYNSRFQYMPDAYLAGLYRFAGEFRYPVFVERDFEMQNIRKGCCYMAVSELDLASMIKVTGEKGLRIGRDIGLLSLDDTPLKEVLAITTVTTDFAFMGQKAADLIRSRKQQRLPNPWRLIERNSL